MPTILFCHKIAKSKNIISNHLFLSVPIHTQAGSSSIFAAGRVLNSNTSKNLVLGAPAALDTGAHLEPSLLLSLGVCGGSVCGLAGGWLGVEWG